MTHALAQSPSPPRPQPVGRVSRPDIPSSSPRSLRLDDFIPIAEAATFTGLSQRHWRRRAAKLAETGLAYQAPPPGGVGKAVWWIARTVDARLSVCPDRSTRDDRVRSSLLERYPEHHVLRAYRKAFWLRAWQQQRAFPRPSGISSRTVAARIVEEAKRVDGPEFRISLRSLQAWETAYKTVGTDGQIRGVEGLVDLYSGPARERSQEAVDYFLSLYHSQAKHSAKTCHDATVRQATTNGWQWPNSYTATTRWLREHENKANACLHRDGRTQYARRHMPYIEIDYTVLQPGERYVFDHSQADFWCGDGDTGKRGNTQIRPWITTCVDARSRVLTGWHWGPVPHQDAIVACMRMAFKEWSIPTRVHIDQGRDFTSELLTGVTKPERRRLRKQHGPDWRDVIAHQTDVFWLGVLGELGVQISEATPYHPWAKGLMERWYSTMHNDFDKTFTTYCGRSSETKPDCVEQLRQGDDVPTLDQVRARFAEYVQLYHLRPHRGLEGLSPQAVWNTATRLRKAKDTELTALLQARGVYRVGANGVRFRIGGAAYGYGATSSRLRQYAGRDVFITLDPADCGYCCAFTAERDSRRFIARLQCNQRIPANTTADELREAVRNIRRRTKDFTKAQSQAPHRMRTAAHEVRALRSHQARELRKTGTDDVPTQPNVAVVRTGLEAASIPDSAAAKTTARAGRKRRDLADAAAALSYGHDLSAPDRARPRKRATLDLLASTSTLTTDSPQDEGEGKTGTDAGCSPAPDVLSLVAEHRHERSTQRD
jgi:hypothetical protein